MSQVRYIFIFMICFLGFFVGIYCIYIYEFFNHGMMIVNSDFFILRHLENNVVFLHSFPVLIRIFFIDSTNLYFLYFYC